MTDSVLLQAGWGDTARLQGRCGQARQFQIPLQGPRPRVWHSKRGGRRGCKIIAPTSFHINFSRQIWNASYRVRYANNSRGWAILQNTAGGLISIPENLRTLSSHFHFLSGPLYIIDVSVSWICKCWMSAFQVFQDGAIVPGWEGKIVAWVEEDHGERR